MTHYAAAGFSCVILVLLLICPRRGRADTLVPKTEHTLPEARSEVMQRLMQPAVTWDVNLETGLGHVFKMPPNALIGFARARAGVLLVRDPFFDSLGVTYEYSGLSPATLRLQAEVAHVETGLWGQLGALYDVNGHGGGMLALGWAVLGVEGQYRGADETGTAWAVYGKVRLPIGILVRALTAK